MEPVGRRVKVLLGESGGRRQPRAVRILETAGAPAVYVPPARRSRRRAPAGVGLERLRVEGRGDLLRRPAPAGSSPSGPPGPTTRRTPPSREIEGFVSFYPALVECFLDDERVEPQPGTFYGGWVTAEITGPIKGVPGSLGW